MCIYIHVHIWIKVNAKYQIAEVRFQSPITNAILCPFLYTACIRNCFLLQWSVCGAWKGWFWSSLFLQRGRQELWRTHRMCRWERLVFKVAPHCVKLAHGCKKSNHQCKLLQWGLCTSTLFKTLNTFLPQVISKPEGIILLSTEQLAEQWAENYKESPWHTPARTLLPFRLVNS